LHSVEQAACLIRESVADSIEDLNEHMPVVNFLHTALLLLFRPPGLDMGLVILFAIGEDFAGIIVQTAKHLTLDRLRKWFLRF
jgi:hypothetical protein